MGELVTTHFFLYSENQRRLRRRRRNLYPVDPICPCIYSDSGCIRNTNRKAVESPVSSFLDDNDDDSRVILKTKMLGLT